MSVPDFLPGLTGSFAQKAAENPTVDIVEAAYKAAGAHVRYINCEVSPEHLKGAIDGAVAVYVEILRKPGIRQSKPPAPEEPMQSTQDQSPVEP